MSYNQHVTLIRDLYKNFSVHDDRIARGIKCPLDLENTKLAMPNYQWLFPRTNYIVGIRHPVLWYVCIVGKSIARIRVCSLHFAFNRFESFYNCRCYDRVFWSPKSVLFTSSHALLHPYLRATVRIHNRFSMPPPGDLVGRCRRGGFNVCTFRGNFHLFLSNLGKTHMATDPDEQQYLAPEFRHTLDPIVKPPGKTSQKIFLYEVSQLSDPDPDRAADLRTTLQSFLNLTIPLDPMIWYRPGKQHKNQWELERLNAKKINICDAQHEALRTVLRYQAGNASRWIRHYFLDAPDVVTSSKEYLRNIILPSWERDPCLDRALSMS